MERWTDITGFEGLYQVSDAGRVRSLNRTHSFIDKGTLCVRHVKGRVLKQSFNPHGYCAVHLGKNSIRFWLRVNRLVATAFIPNPENKPEVHHKREPKTNNRASNLKWVTTAEHHALTVVLGQQTKGSRHGMSKLNESQVTKIRQLAKQGQTRKEVAALFNVSTDMVGRIVRRQNWTHIPLEAIA